MCPVVSATDQLRPDVPDAFYLLRMSLSLRVRRSRYSCPWCSMINSCDERNRSSLRSRGREAARFGAAERGRLRVAVLLCMDDLGRAGDVFK